jgi:preprotein translocase subunit SecD
MLNFSRTKIILILLVSFVGILFAAPNVVPRDMAESLPSWLKPVTLGLDLQGGSHLLLEVDTNAVATEHVATLVEGARTAFRRDRIRYADLGARGMAMTVRILDNDRLEDVRRVLRGLDPDVQIVEANAVFTVSYSERSVIARNNQAVEQSIEIVRRRVDELGTREPSIQRQGAERIVVQLPGLQDPGHMKELLGKTAKLTFHMVDDTATQDDIARGRVPPGSMLLPGVEKSAPGNAPTQYILKRRVEVGGDELVDASATFQNGAPVVSFRFDSVGARKFGDTTRNNVGKPFAIVLDGKVISAPVIREPILGGSGVISGNFTTDEAKDLALLLRAGALPAPMKVIEERTVGPDLGADSIRAGAIASLVGLVLVFVFMIIGYGLFGLFADIALFVNLALLLGVLSLIGGTLTLPGIAGIVLTMGMAVDANVLIYERMREEFVSGRTLINALDAGFSRAFATILDSNLTTIVAAALLFGLGSGPVRGFAVTLVLGLLTSLFTAVWITRLLVAVWARRTRPKTLPI